MELTMDKDEIERANAADTLARLVLFRRLFAELAAMRPAGWLREQEELAQSDLRNIGVTIPNTVLQPAIVELAAGILTKVLTGIITDSPPAGGARR